jgi:fatty acid-binding protein DegV
VQQRGARQIEKRLGVSSSMSLRTSLPTLAYLAMSGRITTASGQASSALNMGMADLTP